MTICIKTKRKRKLAPARNRDHFPTPRFEFGTGIEVRNSRKYASCPGDELKQNLVRGLESPVALHRPTRAAWQSDVVRLALLSAMSINTDFPNYIGYLSIRHDGN
jgi:hypothetical protein